MKKLILLILALTVVLSFCGCGSNAASTLKSQVIEAYNAEDYVTVVSLLDGVEPSDEEILKMLCISEARIAYDSKNYAEAVEKLCGTQYKGEVEFYSKALKAAVENAVAAHDTNALLSLYEADEETEKSAYAIITDTCNSFDYSAFEFLDELLAALPDCSFSDELSEYSKQNKKTRTKAFMQGDWEWINNELLEEGDLPMIVTFEAFDNDEDCIGVLKQASTRMIENYAYEIGELYWKGFTFKPEAPASVQNMTRYADAYGPLNYFVYNLAPIQFDQEKGQMIIHISGASTPDRIWQKIS